jgi:hypothetical protein
MDGAPLSVKLDAMTALSYILLTLGFVTGLYGDIRFLAIAYRHGAGWFLACLFLPLVGWVFFLLYTRETWRPVALSLAGFVLAGFGYALGHFDFL